MTITGSPDIFINEQNFSTYVSKPSVSTGALVGNFEWGPALEATTLDNEAKMLTKFGYPNNNNFKDWYSARNFLSYSGNLRCLRVIGEGSTNACDVKEEATLLKNSSSFSNYYGSLTGTDKTAKIFARYTGDYGNNIRVIISDKDSISKEGNILKPYISKVFGDSDVGVGIFINDAVVEYGSYSFNSDSTDILGYANYIINAVNRSSSYIYLIGEKLITYTDGVRDSIDIDVTLSGGVLVTPTTGDYIEGWNMFNNSETEDISILIQGAGDTTVGAYMIDSIAESRRDCVACVGPTLEDVVENSNALDACVTTSKNYISSSYRFMDCNWKYQYDSYNDTYRWIPCTADTAGLMAQTDNDEEPWYSPAGKPILDCTKLAWYPSKSDRDTLYQYNINPITSISTLGHVLYGDWTGVSDTAFNFLNVRRGFIYMEKGLASYARLVMWKQNDSITQTQFYQAADPFLRDVQGKRGITDYKIYCDASVNTPDIVDAGQFVAKIAIKPTKSVRWVELTFIATRSDAEFDEVVL